MLRRRMAECLCDLDWHSPLSPVCHLNALHSCSVRYCDIRFSFYSCNATCLPRGLTVADMMKIAGAGFQHKSGEVRDAATRLTIKLYRKVSLLEPIAIPVVVD